jgi:predicted RNase H-like HicB family nuclease
MRYSALNGENRRSNGAIACGRESEFPAIDIVQGAFARSRLVRREETCLVMSRGGKNSRRKTKQIQARMEERRRAMAHRFTVIFEKEEEGGYHVFCPTLPGCHTQSETIDEGTRNIREAIQLYIESLIEDGMPIPTEDILIKPIEIPV